MEKEVSAGIQQFNSFALRFVAAATQSAAAAPPPPLFLMGERQARAACSSSSDESDDDDLFLDARDAESLSGGSDDERRVLGRAEAQGIAETEAGPSPVVVVPSSQGYAPRASASQGALSARQRRDGIAGGHRRRPKAAPDRAQRQPDGCGGEGAGASGPRFSCGARRSCARPGCATALSSQADAEPIRALRAGSWVAVARGPAASGAASRASPGERLSPHG